jgi:succinoglycan biosynthesis transport protein ExoP
VRGKGWNGSGAQDENPGQTGSRPGAPLSGRSPADLGSFVSILIRRKWIIIPFVVLMPLAAWAHASGGTARYEASADVLLNRQSQALSGVTDLMVWQPERVIRTQTNIARLPDIAERVVSAARLDRGAGAFLASSSVGSDEQIDLLTFRVRDTDPDLAVALSNLYARKYLEYRRELDTKSLGEALRSVNRQLASLRAAGLSVESSLYASLVQKQEQLRSAQTLQASNALLVREATGAGQVEPKPERTAFLALALGLVLGLGLAFLVDALDTRVREPEELADDLGLALLGSVPAPPRSIRRKRGLVMFDSVTSPDAELFRILRTTLEVTALSGDCRSIMVTSAVKGEGKSTTAANLAVAFARAGRHVVLVDLDVRRPSLNSFFDLERRPGITDIVAETASIEDSTLRLTFDDWSARATRQFAAAGPKPLTETDGRSPTGVLEVIGSGASPPSPAEFVDTSRLDATLKRLAERGDLLIVDGPPLLLAGDALTLSAKVQGVLLVARMNAFRRGQIGELYRVLLASPAVKLGLVATDHSAPFKRSYYGASWRPEDILDEAPARAERSRRVRTPEPETMRVSGPRGVVRGAGDESELEDPDFDSERRSKRQWA